MFKNAVLGNWRTTAIGIILGGYQLHMGGLSWRNAILAALMGALGFAAKDTTTGSQAGQ